MAKQRDDIRTIPSVFYDLLREKAQAMGHETAKLSDDVWDKYVRNDYEPNPLKESKLYIEKYMTGRMSPAALAEIMANDDVLRYTISDICRAKLEPVELDINHNGNYIDVKAGVKTFWTEIHVPLPSEMEAAKDLRNIYFGIEAGKAFVNAEQKDIKANIDALDDSKAEKKSFREKITDKRKALTERFKKPAAAEKPPEFNLAEMDVEAYNSVMQERAAKSLENLAMVVEASKDESLNPKQRTDALMSAGISEERAKALINDKQADHKEVKSNFDNLFSDADIMSAGINSEPSKSGYSREELSQPMNEEWAAFLDQVSAHVNKDKAGQRKTNIPDKKQEAVNEPTQEKEKRLRKGYVSGEFEGKEVRFKGSWSNHVFTENETSKLLAGEAISFTHINKDGEEKTIYGKLEWQNYDGREYLGFKANFAKKEAVAEQQPDYFAEEQNDMQMSSDDINKLFDGVPDLSADMAEYKSMTENDEVVLTEADVAAVSEVPGMAQ